MVNISIVTWIFPAIFPKTEKRQLQLRHLRLVRHDLGQAFQLVLAPFGYGMCMENLWKMYGKCGYMISEYEIYELLNL